MSLRGNWILIEEYSQEILEDEMFLGLQPELVVKICIFANYHYYVRKNFKEDILTYYFFIYEVDWVLEYERKSSFE